MKFLTTAAIALLAVSTIAAAQDRYYDRGHHTQTARYQAPQKVFVFSPRDKHWVAYENGHKVASGVANGGMDGHRTPVGVFHVMDKAGPYHVSSVYPKYKNGSRGGAPMPYAMHFTKIGHAIHGSPQIYNHNSSHGCIRVKTSAAKWLNESFMTRGTTVIVRPY